MRHIHRGTIPKEVRIALKHQMVRCGDSAAAKQQWKTFRSTIACRPIVDELTRMAGVRNRCFYCSDSRAADVEHYWPIAIRYELTFTWKNLLWVCPECNRRKVSRFPVGDGGVPQLVDPTLVDPWQHFTLATSTGWVAPRFHGAIEDVVGRETLNVLATLNFEAVAEGRLETVRRLHDAALTAAAVEDSAANAKALWKEVGYDERGVAAWFAFWDGQREEPFASLKATRPRIWRHFVRRVACK
jgi:uncharacterized protein (TIGR02646 family)